MTRPMRTSGSVPIPDPTELTTDAVALARNEIEKLFDTKLEGFERLIGEKFKGVATEFTMRDIALAAAFKAAEAAVKQQNESNTLAIDKAATATTKQIDSLVERIDDLKERIAELGRKNWSAVGGYIIGAIGILAAVAVIGSAVVGKH
jgi:polyhydroxyalkanoate synthesis regulator phasin